MLKACSSAVIPTPYGDFEFIAFSNDEDNQMPHIVLKSLNKMDNEVQNVRLHSECLTGDLFQSRRCDCGEQLENSMQYIQKNGGFIIYLRQEGRGIGIINKLRAYRLQDTGLDTVEANVSLGFDADSREYQDAIDILKALGIVNINLITNNPAKISALEGSEINVIKRIPIVIPTRPENDAYFKTKSEKMGHIFE